MSPHADACRVLAAWRAPDAEQEDLRVAYLHHLETHRDGVDDATQRGCRPDHLTSSVLICTPDASRVLLTLHARIGRWLQTGGHCEPGDATLAAAALREGREESGLETLVLDPVPVLLSRHEVPCGPDRPAHHLDVQHVATAPADAVPVRSEESSDLAWFAADALPERTDESVRALVAAAADRLDAGAQPLPADHPSR